MIREYEIKCLKGIRDGMLIYEVDGKTEKIEIKNCAECWWDYHHKRTLMDVLLNRRAKNIYAGDKCFNFAESYIKVYVGQDEIVFKKIFSDEVDTSDACEFRKWWGEINKSLNQQGYWLFDKG